MTRSAVAVAALVVSLWITTARASDATTSSEVPATNRVLLTAYSVETRDQFLGLIMSKAAREKALREAHARAGWSTALSAVDGATVPFAQTKTTPYTRSTTVSSKGKASAVHADLVTGITGFVEVLHREDCSLVRVQFKWNELIEMRHEGSGVAAIDLPEVAEHSTDQRACLRNDQVLALPVSLGSPHVLLVEVAPLTDERVSDR